MKLPSGGRGMGGALVFEDVRLAHGWVFTVYLAATPAIRGGRPAVARVIHPHFIGTEEVEEMFHRTVGFRQAIGEMGVVPRVLGVERTPERSAVIEGHAGDVTLPDLLRVSAEKHRRLPHGVALRLARTVLALHERARQIDPGLRPNYHERDVRLGWDGSIRLLANEGPDASSTAHGAAAGIIRGHFGLLSPQQIRGETSSPFDAIFGTGVLAYYALVGEHPLHRPDDTELQRLQNTIQQIAPSPRAARRDVPPDLAALVERCLRPKREDRFASWEELGDALHDCSREVEPFGSEHLAMLLHELFPKEADEARDRDEQIAALDLSGIPGAPLAPGVLPSPLPPTPPVDPDDTVIPDAAVYGADARPAFRAGETLLVDHRPVSNAEYARFVIAGGAAAPPHWRRATPPPSLENLPVTHVSPSDARAYATWARKRLPTADEWRQCVALLGDVFLGTGLVWEWTATPFREGFLVCGGQYRDRPHDDPGPDHVSHASRAASDIGFRCVADRP